jgi:hypothetical protein
MENRQENMDRHSDCESEEERMLTLDDIEYNDKSSSESDENEDFEEEKKLMDDSALYDHQKKEKIKPSPLKVLDHLDEESEGSHASTPVMTPKKSSRAQNKSKVYSKTTADVDTKSDPLRTRPKPDIVRVNSYSYLSIPVDLEDLEDRQKEKEAEKSINRSSILSQSVKKSILKTVDQGTPKVGRESLSGTKIFNPTKRESKISSPK